MRANDFELLLFRHGDAEDWSASGDDARALTPDGLAAMERAAGALEVLGLSWSEAWTSPLTRARQTADALWRVHSPWAQRQDGMPLPEPKPHDALRVDSSARVMAEFLVKRGQRFAGPRPCIAAFGHQPTIEGVLSLLLTGDQGLRCSVGRGDLLHLFVPAPSPFDTVLVPMAQEPLPRAVLLGFYPRAALERVALGGRA